MQKIKIGVLDSEQEYVTKLSAYLQRYGGMRWEVSAFTNEDTLKSYLQKRKLDVLMGTNQRQLMNVKADDCVARLFLVEESDGENMLEADKEWKKNIYVAYRFQSAKKIGQCLEGVIRQEQLVTSMGIPMVAMYSPVGRCGKTSLLLDMVDSGTYGRWIYIGMEDYSSFVAEDCLGTDEFWYYLKEKKREQLLNYIQEVKGVVGSGTSYFDLRRIDRKDIGWMREVLKDSDYRGVVFDIGSGVLQSVEFLKGFDYWLVPYVEEEIAKRKSENMKRLLECSGMEECYENMICFNIGDTKEVQTIWKKVFGGNFI